jgi:hypothetical protein
MRVVFLAMAIGMLFPLIVSMFVLSGIQVQAASTPRIYLDPSGNTFNTITTRVGDRFNITVRVENAPNIGGWNLGMEFNDDVLRVIRWFEPTTDPGYTFHGKTTSALPFPPDPGYTHLPGKGRIILASNLFPTPPDQPPSSGSGKLCILELNVTAAPTSGELSSSLAIDTGNTFLIDADGFEVPGVAYENGLYRYIFTSAIPPYLAVSPAYQNVTGMTFNVSVLANQVESSINLDTVELSLAYDQSILATEPSNVTLDSLWNGPNSTTVADGKVDITVTHPATTPNGIVPIGTINFAILQQTQASLETLGSNISSGLNFVHVRFLSAGHEIPADPSKNGTVNIYAMPLPPKPYLVVNPSSITFRPSENITDRPFNITVLVQNVSSSLHLKTISIILSYNQSVLNTSESNITLGNLWGNGSMVSVTDGQLNIIATNPSSADPNGTVLVGNITFTAHQEISPPEPLGSYENETLIFVYSMLRNTTNGQIMQAPPVNGLIRIYPYQTQAPLLTITEPVTVGLGGVVVVDQFFQSNVTIGEVFDLQHVGLFIRFDQSIINCSNIQLGTELSQYMTQTSQMIDNIDGYAYVEAVVSGPTVLSGTLFTLTFKAEAIGKSWLNFSQPYGVDTYLTDSTETVISVRYYEREVNVISGIPEFSPLIILPLFITATLLACVVRRKKHVH